MEDTEIVGFEEGLTSALVSTVHGVETKGLTPLGFPCSNSFEKCNLGCCVCGTMEVYVLLE